ncbi:MAG TPA: hypothetical protein VJ963_13255 [Bacteroidales bacterium]|nr:hypothetical protein [Bacteroidales bacterium]
MKRLLPLLVLIVLFLSCRKSKDSGDFLREKSFGSGTALFIASTNDSGLVVCGSSDGKPLLVRLDNSFFTMLEVSDIEAGSFSSALFDTTGYVTGGNSGGDILLCRYSRTGRQLWRKTIDAGYSIGLTKIFNTGSGNILAVCSAGYDSVSSGSTGLYFVRLDTTGVILAEDNIPSASFIAAGDAALDADGNIYLAITRKEEGAKPVAVVTKLDEQYQKLWETDLYNNPEFSASARGIMLDPYGNIYVTGGTEVATSGGTLSNTFAVSLDNDGSIRDNWKKYPEELNEGAALLPDASGNILVLNRYCCVVSVLGADDGSLMDRIRIFSLCYPDNTDAFGTSFALSGNNIMVAGSLGGSFFTGLKSTR